MADTSAGTKDIKDPAGVALVLPPPARLALYCAAMRAMSMPEGIERVQVMQRAIDKVKRTYPKYFSWR